jgi:hypothetical protein
LRHGGRRIAMHGADQARLHPRAACAMASIGTTSPQGASTVS